MTKHHVCKRCSSICTVTCTAQALAAICFYDQTSDAMHALQADEDDIFIQALQQYLRSNMYSTGTSSKLWAAVGEVSGQPVQRWLQQWTYQGGFPLIQVAQQGLRVTVSQVNTPYTSFSTRSLSHCLTGPPNKNQKPF